MIFVSVASDGEGLRTVIGDSTAGTVVSLKNLHTIWLYDMTVCFPLFWHVNDTVIVWIAFCAMYFWHLT